MASDRGSIIEGVSTTTSPDKLRFGWDERKFDDVFYNPPVYVSQPIRPRIIRTLLDAVTDLAGGLARTYFSPHLHQTYLTGELSRLAVTEINPPLQGYAPGRIGERTTDVDEVEGLLGSIGLLAMRREIVERRKVEYTGRDRIKSAIVLPQAEGPEVFGDNGDGRRKQGADKSIDAEIGVKIFGQIERELTAIARMAAVFKGSYSPEGRLYCVCALRMFEGFYLAPNQLERLGDPACLESAADRFETHASQYRREMVARQERLGEQIHLVPPALDTLRRIVLSAGTLIKKDRTGPGTYGSRHTRAKTGRMIDGRRRVNISSNLGSRSYARRHNLAFEPPKVVSGKPGGIVRRGKGKSTGEIADKNLVRGFLEDPTLAAEDRVLEVGGD